MSFDSSQHEAARRYFTLAVKLAAEAEDAPLAGHVLRAMAHQATDLGHPKKPWDIATASVEHKRRSGVWSGSRRPLLIPGPLRTGRASFPRIRLKQATR
ncbi:hypothetical protein M2283_009778, partial [Streptomyces pseudovenezuelae]|nr:hypothetical protein [Streptomyces pseudovenezuelae]